MILRIGRRRGLAPCQIFDKHSKLLKNPFSVNYKGLSERPLKFGTGFTLVEMLVVLAIIAMLLGLSIPFTTGFGKGLRIKTAARAIIATLRVAQSNAITYRREYTVIFDTKDNSYWVEDLDGKIFEAKRRLPSSIRFAIPDDESSDPITFEDDKVTFYSTGAIGTSNGSITITDRQGSSKTISIFGSTGKIFVE